VVCPGRRVTMTMRVHLARLCLLPCKQGNPVQRSHPLHLGKLMGSHGLRDCHRQGDSSTATTNHLQASQQAVYTCLH
jgi:hypothetical protein